MLQLPTLSSTENDVKQNRWGSNKLITLGMLMQGYTLRTEDWVYKRKRCQRIANPSSGLSQRIHRHKYKGMVSSYYQIYCLGIYIMDIQESKDKLKRLRKHGLLTQNQYVKLMCELMAREAKMLNPKPYDPRDLPNIKNVDEVVLFFGAPLEHIQQ